MYANDKKHNMNVCIIYNASYTVFQKLNQMPYFMPHIFSNVPREK